ncbi:MAG: Maf family protein [Promethearchaeota archaeon]
MKKIILASKSVDRSRLLKQAGITFKVVTSNIDEEKYKTTITDPIELSKELAKAKALSTKTALIKDNLDYVIIAADTIVELNGEIIGKAKNKVQAFKILKKLSGKTHNLITGIAIIDTIISKIIVDYDITSVEFLALSDKEIRGYINTNEWKGRAGAYSIEDKASLFINKIIGSSSNVMGLPMQKLYKILKKEFNVNLFQMD